jgi:type VI secretion system (T6SS) effector Hcp
VAYQFYITIEGSKQGVFKGSAGSGDAKVARSAHKQRIAGIKFLSETTSPRDTATGQASGKRIHKPISITKQWDAASPQLFQALVNNETLNQCSLNLLRRTRTDRMKFTIPSSSRTPRCRTLGPTSISLTRAVTPTMRTNSKTSPSSSRRSRLRTQKGRHL